MDTTITWLEYYNLYYKDKIQFKTFKNNSFGPIVYTFSHLILDNTGRLGTQITYTWTEDDYPEKHKAEILLKWVIGYLEAGSWKIIN